VVPTDDSDRTGPDFPTFRADDHFIERHETFLRLPRERPLDVLLLGDSITRRWAEFPEEWRRWFGDLNAANFGVGGDCTENVLWRVLNGELDGISARAIVLLIGTNNIPRHRPDEIAVGISRLVEAIRQKLPESTLLLIGILPRGPQRKEIASDERPYYMEAVRTVNSRISRLANGRSIRYVDPDGMFLGSDGEIDPDKMPDGLHLVEAGYRLLGARIRPIIDEMMR